MSLASSFLPRIILLAPIPLLIKCRSLQPCYLIGIASTSLVPALLVRTLKLMLITVYLANTSPLPLDIRIDLLLDSTHALVPVFPP